MRVILIDDEPLALEHMEKLLAEIGDLKVVGKYINPQQGLKAIMQDRPDVVFLDIEMPTTNGIELAEKLQNSHSDVHIVFVTAYDEYAVKAFELNAVDYVMKPVQRKRLSETIKRLQPMKRNHMEKDETNHSGMICCFQTLQFARDSGKPEKIKVHWRTSKAKEVFAFLVHHRRKPVRKEVLLDLFWPEADMNKGFAQLYAAIYQIRKTLSSIDFHINITSHDYSYILDLQEIQIDIEEFENGLEGLFKKRDPEFLSVQKLLDLYSGDYLSEESYLWAESERERLRLLWLHYTQKTTELLIQKEEYMSALIIYQRMQALHPYLEESYFMLMKLYDLLGERNSVEVQYRTLNEMLLNEYGMTPAPYILEWYEHWKDKTITM
ncbi:response regulator [Siminovitchia sp. 179-K 8D1 HS]|uniref:response regulator n=1 Tax=Siminovitchia sp. 179-K 8D1 HS TaxID=3142385 RepID=UPI0039A2A045